MSETPFRDPFEAAIRFLASDDAASELSGASRTGTAKNRQ
jgi:hypothetical protein